MNLIDFYNLEAFKIKEPEEVNTFLLKNPNLLPLLEDTYPHVEQYFGRGTTVTLEVVRDPEYSNSEMLVAYIQSDRQVKDALDCLDMLDLNWLFEASVNLEDKILFHVE